MLSDDSEQVFPINYWNGSTFTWTQGRLLSTVTKSDGTSITYKYRNEGLRYQKTVGGVNTRYFWVGDKIYSQYSSNQKIAYWYDENGSVAGFIYNGTKYYLELCSRCSNSFIMGILFLLDICGFLLS